MYYQDRRVVMAFKAHHLPNELCIGTIAKDSGTNPSLRVRLYFRTEDMQQIRISPVFARGEEGKKPVPLQTGELIIVPRTKTGANQITGLRLSKKTDANVPTMPSRLINWQDTAGFKWSHYMECSFSGCYAPNWESAPDIAPELQDIWHGLRSLRLGGTIRLWIQEVGTNDINFAEFMHDMENASVPWLRYRSIGNTAHWIKFNGQLPPLPLKVKKDGSTEVDRETAVVRFMDLHDYEVRLGVAIKRDDAYQTAKLKAYEDLKHSITIKALQGTSEGYMYALVKVNEKTRKEGKMPSLGTEFQIEWWVTGQTSEDADYPQWQGNVIHKPFWTPADVDFVMATRQPVGGRLPSVDGGNASLSAQCGHASSRRKLQAIHRLCYPELKSAMLSRLRTILVGEDLTNLKTVNLCHGHDNWEQLPEVVAAMSSLNPFQRQAMLHALWPPGGIGIITGPPGTGKTHLVVALTKVLSTLGHKVLLCTPSNNSTNHLASAIHRKYPELEVIRVYRPTAEDQQIKGEVGDGEDGHADVEGDVHVSRTMDTISTLAQIQGDKRGRVAHKHLCLTMYCIKRAKQIERQREEHNLLSGKECKLPKVDAFLDVLRLYENKFRPSRQQLKESGKQLEEISRSVMATASVVVTTCNGANGNTIKQFYNADVVIFDEAAQTDEPDTLIALTQESVKAFVMVGDINQLQPVVVSNQENEFAPQLERSMQFRLMQAGYPSCGLRIQYRMLPAISDWPNKTFYNESLINDKSTYPNQRPLASEFSGCLTKTWGIPRTNRVMVQPSLRYAITGPNGSLTNYPNINLVISMVKQLVATTTIKASQISIISLYELQRLNYIHVLETLRMTNQLIRPLIEGVEVATVDSFQGKENEVVFLDLVTVGGPKGVGFVRDAKRLGVGTTRARCGLVVVSYEHMLGDKWKHDMHKCLHSMVTYIRKNNHITTIGVVEDYTTAVLESGQIRYEPEDYPGFEPSKPKRRRGDSPGPSGQHGSKRSRQQVIRTQQPPISLQLSPDESDDDYTGLAKGKGKSKAVDKDMGTEVLRPLQDLGSLAVEAKDTTIETTDTTVEAMGAVVETMDIAIADTDP
ncbi:MAG: hypothetical protein M1839_003605 [Geoglossum umbratile]|nr:MAG: hypothetical protein M1839_003605 [Geoglossum umbratile]